MRINVRWTTQEFNAILDESLVHDKSNASGLAALQACSTHLHPNSDIQLEEALDAVQIPSVDADVIDGWGQHKDTVQLTDPVSWEVDLDTVEKSMLKVFKSIYLYMEDRPCMVIGNKDKGQVYSNW